MCVLDVLSVPNHRSKTGDIAAMSVVAKRASRFSSSLYNYRKIVKDATKNEHADRLYTTRDCSKAVVCLTSFKGGLGDWSLNRWYLKNKVNPTNRNRYVMTLQR